MIGPSLPSRRDAVARGANQSRKYLRRDTPLHLAGRRGDVDRTRSLLDNCGSEIDLETRDTSTNGSTSLYIAAEEGHLEVARLLIEHGADVNTKSLQTIRDIDFERSTVLQIASNKGHAEIVLLLLEHGADIEGHVDLDDSTPLYYAIEGGHIEVVKLLLKNGADLVVRPSLDYTALHCAATWTNNTVEIMSLLFEHGAERYIGQVDDRGYSALKLAVINDRAQVVRILLEQGADFRSPPQLHEAAYRSCVEIVRILLENGADVTQLDKFGLSAIHNAVYGTPNASTVEILSLLFDYGSDPNARDKDGLTALHLAALYANVDGVRVLLQHGANVSSIAKGKGTALHCAINCPIDNKTNKGIADVVRLLLENGADGNALDDDGFSAKQLSRMKGNKDVMRLLGATPLGPDVEASRRVLPGQNTRIRTEAQLAQLDYLSQCVDNAPSFGEVLEAVEKYDDYASSLDSDHLRSMAFRFHKRFRVTNDERYFNLAIELQELYSLESEASNTSQTDLATMLLERYEQFSHSPIDLDRAMQGYRTDMAGSFYGRDRFQAALSYAELCLKYRDAEASVRPYQITLDHIRYIVSPGLPYNYSGIPAVRDTVTSAVASAVEAGYFLRSLDWFERGRCIVWGYILRFREPIDKLRDAAPELATNMEYIVKKLSDTEDSLLDRHYRSPSYVGGAVNYGQMVSEFTEHVQEANALAGLEGFLRPKPLDELIESTTGLGPVIVLNCAKRRCDALVLQQGCKDILHVPLPKLTHGALGRITLDFQHYLHRTDTSIRKIGLAQMHSKSTTLENILQVLWTSVVEPVFRELGLMNPPHEPRSNLPRITWCASGSLASLPLHAAGIYNQDCSYPQKAFEYAIHSYTPSLSALSEAVKQRKLVQVPTVEPTIFAVSQPATPRQDPLPGTVAEVSAIKQAVGSERLKWLDDTDATVANVFAHIHQHPWVHLACHAVQDPVNPIQSKLMLHDGDLSLRAMMRNITTSSRKTLSVLSACQTATGDEKMPEEAVHLAAGMLMTGFQSSIATMWSIHDTDAPIVMKAFYSYLLNEAQGDSAKSASALHHATKHLRDKVGEKNFLHWVPFIHLGI